MALQREHYIGNTFMPSMGVISISLYNSSVLTKCWEQTLRWSCALVSRFACACVIPSHDCFSSRRWQRILIALLGLCYIKLHLSNRLALTDTLPFSLAGFEDTNCHAVENPIRRNMQQELWATSRSYGQLLNNSQQEVRTLSLTVAKK